MNQAMIVRADVDQAGLRLRLWIDDEFGRHVTTAELILGHKAVRAWLQENDEARNDEAQEQLPYEK